MLSVLVKRVTKSPLAAQKALLIAEATPCQDEHDQVHLWLKDKATRLERKPENAKNERVDAFSQTILVASLVVQRLLVSLKCMASLLGRQ